MLENKIRFESNKRKEDKIKIDSSEGKETEEKFEQEEPEEQSRCLSTPHYMISRGCFVFLLNQDNPNLVND